MNKKLSLLLLLASSSAYAADSNVSAPKVEQALVNAQEAVQVLAEAAQEAVTPVETTTTTTTTTVTEVKVEAPAEVAKPGFLKTNLVSMKQALSNAAVSTKVGAQKAATYTVEKVTQAAAYTKDKTVAGVSYANDSLKVESKNEAGETVRVYSKVRVAAATIAVAAVAYGIYKLATRNSSEEESDEYAI